MKRHRNVCDIDIDGDGDGDGDREHIERGKYIIHYIELLIDIICMETRRFLVISVDVIWRARPFDRS